MTCVSQLHHPTSPCCGHPEGCRWLPGIDFGRVAWLVRFPTAAKIEQRFAVDRFVGDPFAVSSEEGEDLTWGYVGSQGDSQSGFTLNVYYSWHDYLFRGGQHIAANSSTCRWTVKGRERLYRNDYSVIRAGDTSSPPRRSAKEFSVNTEIPSTFAMAHRGLSGEYAFSDDANLLASWRDILLNAECTLIPSSAYVDYDPHQGGALQMLENVKQAINNPAAQNRSSFYKPTALDLAVESTLSHAFSFGVEGNQHSPFFNQFVVFDDGTFETDEDDNSYLTATIWNPVEEFKAEFGHANRFERSNDWDWLPDWVEFELIPHKAG